MNGPLHPSLVHLPLGLAVALPPLLAALAIAIRRGALRRRTWWLAVGLQALLFAGGIAAMQAGDRDEKTVTRVVSRSVVHEHEEKGEAFVWAAGLALAVVAGVAFAPDRLLAAGTALSTVAALAVAGMGVRAGRAGGELVYENGAARAWETTGNSGPPAAVSPHAGDRP